MAPTKTSTSSASLPAPLLAFLAQTVNSALNMHDLLPALGAVVKGLIDAVAQAKMTQVQTNAETNEASDSANEEIENLVTSGHAGWEEVVDCLSRLTSSETFGDDQVAVVTVEPDQDKALYAVDLRPMMELVTPQLTNLTKQYEVVKTVVKEVGGHKTKLPAVARDPNAPPARSPTALALFTEAELLKHNDDTVWLERLAKPEMTTAGKPRPESLRKRAMCAEIWQKMTSEQKAPWEAKAKQAKEELKRLQDAYQAPPEMAEFQAKVEAFTKAGLYGTAPKHLAGVPRPKAVKGDKAPTKPVGDKGAFALAVTHKFYGVTDKYTAEQRSLVTAVIAESEKLAEQAKALREAIAKPAKGKGAKATPPSWDDKSALAVAFFRAELEEEAKRITAESQAQFRADFLAWEPSEQYRQACKNWLESPPETVEKAKRVKELKKSADRPTKPGAVHLMLGEMEPELYAKKEGEKAPEYAKRMKAKLEENKELKAAAEQYLTARKKLFVKEAQAYNETDEGAESPIAIPATYAKLTDLTEGEKEILGIEETEQEQEEQELDE